MRIRGALECAWSVFSQSTPTHSRFVPHEWNRIAEGLGLRHVLALPSAYDVLHAGEWGQDGTREHWVYDASLEIRYIPTPTGGAPTLRVRLAGTEYVRELRWDDGLGVYRCGS
jgi:hypothetical protein